MKKIIIFLLAILSMFFCVACSDEVEFEYHAPNGYDLTNASVSILQISGEETFVLKEFGTNCPILNDLLNVPCYQYFNDPCIDLGGYAILIQYNEENYETITASAIQVVIDGKLHYGQIYFDSDLFNALIETYLNSQTP